MQFKLGGKEGEGQRGFRVAITEGQRCSLSALARATSRVPQSGSEEACGRTETATNSSCTLVTLREPEGSNVRVAAIAVRQGAEGSSGHIGGVKLDTSQPSLVREAWCQLTLGR